MSRGLETKQPDTGMCQQHGNFSPCSLCDEDEKRLRKAGVLRGGTPEEQELLSDKEAVAYQDYTTKKDNVPFNEKASEASYEESDNLIKKLRDADIHLEFLDIDWNKIDFNNAYAIGDLKTRLDVAARQFLDQMRDGEEIDNEETKGFFDKAREFLKNNKAAALPLALSVSLLIGCGKESINSGKKIVGEVTGESGKVIETVVKDSGIETSYGEDSSKILKEWKDKHPEVTKIVLSDLSSSVDTLHESHKLVTIAGERFKAAAKIIIFTENETFFCHGDIESPDLHYVPGFSEMTTYAGKGLNKLLGKEGLEVDRVNELWLRNGKNAAIKKALENYESKISKGFNKAASDAKSAGVYNNNEKKVVADASKKAERGMIQSPPRYYKFLKKWTDEDPNISGITLNILDFTGTEKTKDSRGEKDIYRRAVKKTAELTVVFKDGTKLHSYGSGHKEAVETPILDKIVNLSEKILNKIGINYKSDKVHRFADERLVKMDEEYRAVREAMRRLRDTYLHHYADANKKSVEY